MASAIFSFISSISPFHINKGIDDLKVSDKLVRRLKIHECSKDFVFALRDSDSGLVVYLLATQSLSKQSVLDIEHLIKVIRPKAVVAQVASSALTEILAEEKALGEGQSNKVPTSSFEVFKACLIEKVNKQGYEKLAGYQILNAIFGVGFYGNILVAKRASEEVGSHFVLLESPYEGSCSPVLSEEKSNGSNQSSGLQLQTSCLLPGKVDLVVRSNFNRFCFTEKLQTQLEKLIPALDSLIPKARLLTAVSDTDAAVHQPEKDYQIPPFAQSVYPLLEDLHNIFMNHPTVGTALASAQKLIAHVSKGETVNSHLLFDAQNFQFTVEGLRMALTKVGRCPIDKMEKGSSNRLDFYALSMEEKCHAVSAWAIKEQAKKYGTVVAIVDAGSLGGLRRQWDAQIPSEFMELAQDKYLAASNSENFTRLEGDDLEENARRKRKPLSEKPVVAVGASATAILGASSLSKAVPASAIVKFASFKIPFSLKFSLAHVLRASTGMAGSGTKASALKFVASTEKIRAVTHGMLTSAKRTSLLAIRTSFYEIMRGRHAAPFKAAPWATFSCSVAAGAGLLMYGDAIESAAESFPLLPTIATLGRGLQSLQRASQELMETTQRTYRRLKD